jgi:hypothetical protein
VLTHRQTTNARRQNIARQQQRQVSETLEVLTLRSGAGVQELGIYRPKAAPVLLPAHDHEGEH